MLPDLVNTWVEPGADKPHARICEGESRIAELLDHSPGEILDQDVLQIVQFVVNVIVLVPISVHRIAKCHPLLPGQDVRGVPLCSRRQTP